MEAIARTFTTRPVRLPDGLLMDLDPSEWIQLEILTRGAAEPVTLQLTRKLVAEGDVVIDVGAHVGHHTLVAARAAGATGSVHAFDPQPYNADRIARNVEHNGLGNVVVVCAAVGAENVFIRIPIQSQRDRARLSLLAPGPNDLNTFVEVPLRRLDSYIDEHRLMAPKLVKIDVEGYELAVLRGLGERLKDCRNVILEVLDDADPERTREAVDLLTANGFSLRDCHGQPWKHGAPLVECNVWAVR
jgi:FkbM family methyltransferase